MTTAVDKPEAVKALTEKAAAADSPEDALKFSQAAVNVANALRVLADLPEGAAMNSHVHPVMATILEAYVPEPKDIDISPEAVDRMIDDLWQYGTVIGKKPTAQDATCHHAADMVDALRIALTAEQAGTKVLDDALNAAIKERDGAFEQVDQLRASLTARGSPWIACAAQMPTTWAKCLVWDGHDVFQATYQLKDGGLDGRKAGLWYDVCDGLDLVGITHWMLQPEGPK
ncbi:MAG TPA: DUF551 domain-containing protein [Terriglobales bacterium]|jgi:hypothetical protein|nr:DUF551 domain-containing protein [Terriglobales bacterium]